MFEWSNEIRLAVRRLRQSTGFTLGAMATLALGIGATTAIFSVASAVLLRPLPYPEPERLVSVGQVYPDGLGAAGEPKFLFWREKSRVFESLACYSSYGGASGNLAGGDEAEFVRGLRVSEDFFKTLGVAPRLGRSFTHEEDTPGAQRVAVISDGLWRRRFGSDPGVIGREVTLDDAPLTIVGVMSPEFRVESAADVLLPMQARPTANHDPNATVVGRLSPGRTLSEAQAEMRVIAEQYRALAPRHMAEGESIAVRPYQETFTEGSSKTLWVLLGAVSFLLMIACANVAHLNLSRASSREREFAVRAALGGGARRIALQLMTESLLLSLGAGLGGLWVASIGTRLILATLPPGFLPDVATVSFDWRVLVFALGAAIVSGVASGLAPVFQTRKLDVSAALKAGGEKGGTGRGRLRSALVVTEVALCVALVGGALLLTRTFANLTSVGPGFDARNVLTFQVAPAGARYDTTLKSATFYREAIERLSHIQRVEAVGITNKLPLDWQFNMPVVFQDAPDKGQSMQVRFVSPDYFRAIGIPLTAGRPLSTADDATRPQVAMVNEAFARRFLEGRPPFSRLLSVGRGLGDSPREVVGVVGDAKQSGLDRPAPPMVFIPVDQVPDRLLISMRAFTFTSFVIRAAGQPEALMGQIRSAFASMDPTLAISGVASMEEVTARSLASQRFNTILLLIFGGVALTLSLVGVYGVMSHLVARQSREIGVRVALGAGSRDVSRMVLGQGLRLVSGGVVLGAALFLGLSGVMQSLLFEVSARDPLVIIGSVATLCLTALAASYVPARRAASMDPIVSLRSE